MEPNAPVSEPTIPTQPLPDQKIKNKKIPFLVGGAVVILVFIFTAVLLFIKPNNSSNNPETPKQTQNTTPTTNPPQPEFGSYVFTGTNPTVPLIAKTYALKTEFSEQYSYELGAKLGISEFKRTNTNYIIGSNTKEANKIGLLSFDLSSGQFDFASYGKVIPTTASGTTPQDTALAMLTELGIADSTITCQISYKNSSSPGVTFVECHRDWQKTGLPIYSFAGLANTDPQTKLSSFVLGTVDSSSPSDSRIYDISTGVIANGKARPNDFNTATVGVFPDGSIASIKSNLRIIETTKEIARSDIQTPEDALSRLKTNDAEVFLTLPQGSGTVDWATVYKNNKAVAKTATITDYVLSYLEKPSTEKQSNLVPMYTVRGQAQLDSGYTVSFVATVPALKDNTSFLATEEKKNFLSNFSVVKKVHAQDAKQNLQLKTFTPPPSQPPTATPTELPEGATITPTNPPSENISQCTNSPQTDPIELTIPGMGTLSVVLLPDGKSAFYIKSATFPIDDMNVVKSAFFKAVEEQYTINVARYIVTNNLAVTNANIIFSDMNFGASCPSSIGSKTYLAPFPTCPQGSNINVFLAGKVDYEFAQMASVASNVAQKINSIAGTSSLNAYSKKPNLFPQTSNDLLWVAFVSDPNKVSRYTACYITGVSPALFLYTKSPINAKITLPQSTTYSFPSLFYNSWDIVTSQNGWINTRSEQFPYLYYEYNKELKAPNDGFVVKYEQAEEITKQIAEKAGLNANETNRLVLDVKNELTKQTKSEYLKLGVVSQVELNNKLPINISPLPDTLYRLHISLTPLGTNDNSTQPVILPVNRHGFTAVEVGAFYK